MRAIRRGLGALLMGAGGLMLASTLLSLGRLFAESKAPFWLTAAVALVFLGLETLLFLLGRGLWRRERPEAKNGEESETAAEESKASAEGSEPAAEESEPAAEESKAAAGKSEPEEPGAAAEEKSE